MCTLWLVEQESSHIATGQLRTAIGWWSNFTPPLPITYLSRSRRRWVGKHARASCGAALLRGEGGTLGLSAASECVPLPLKGSFSETQLCKVILSSLIRRRQDQRRLRLGVILSIWNNTLTPCSCIFESKHKTTLASLLSIPFLLLITKNMRSPPNKKNSSYHAKP